jgi:hypothetical protein
VGSHPAAAWSNIFFVTFHGNNLRIAINELQVGL